MLNRRERSLDTLGGRIVAAAGALWIAASTYGLGVKESSLRSAEAKQSERSIADGRQAFESRCAGCHGIDGRGGERAPDIATSAKTQRRSDSALAQIINNSAALPGNPQNGKAIFFGPSRCSECHLAAGAGGFIASDLSSYGRSRPVEEIRDAIVKPNQPSNAPHGTVTIATRAGQTVTGVLRNEDNFSLQLQSLDGAFHLLMKSDVASIKRDSNSLMPADYGSTLSAGELNDLVSFLMSVAQQDKSIRDPKKNEPSDEEE